MSCGPILVGLLGAPAARAGSPASPPVGAPPQALVEARLAGGWSPGTVPPFQAAEVDAATGLLDLRWQPDRRVGLGVRAGLLHHSGGLAEPAWGPDETTLSVRLEPLPVGLLPVDLQLAWSAAVPWSFDAGQVGTDETATHLYLGLARRLGPLHLSALGGLAILGNPLRFADQDDVPLAGLAARWVPAGPPLVVEARVGGQLSTPRNPARTEALASLETGCPWRLGVEGGPGLSLASADWSVRGWVGWAVACRDPAGD